VDFTKDTAPDSNYGGEEQPSEDDSQEARPAPTDADGERPRDDDADTSSSKKSWLVTHWNQIAIAVVATVMASALVPLVTPLPSIPVKFFDAVRDGFRGYEGKYADDAREQVPDRDFWREEPTLFDSSFDWIGEGYPESLLETSGGRLAYRSVPETVREAPDLAGRPISVVGKVTNETDLEDRGGIGFDASMHTEYRLAGPDESAEVRAGLAQSIIGGASIGDVVVMHGLVLARGVSEPPGEAPRDTAYLYITEISATDSYSGDLDTDDPTLRRLIRQLR
jgi:hypothetical protein